MGILALQAILKWLGNNWKIVAVLAAVAGVYFYGSHNGKVAERAVCDAEIQAEKDAQQLVKDKLQRDADKKSADYEKERAADQVKLNDVKRRLENEKKKNIAFATCHAGPDFLRIYETAAGRAGAAGDSSR